MNGPPVQHRAAADRPAEQWDVELADRAVGDRSVMRGEPELVAVHAEDRGVERLAQTGGALAHAVEHGPNVCGRAADHAEDVGRGRLLSERVAQLAVARFKLREEARVRDGHGRLIGEGAEKGDLLGREGTDLGAADDDGADCDAPAQQWRRQHGPRARLALEDGGLLELAPGGACEVAYMDRPPVQDCPTEDGTAVDRDDLPEPPHGPQPAV